MSTMISKPKRMQDKNAIDLRIVARGKDDGRATSARAELRRRVNNLDRAVIPAWELELRGPDPDHWELVG